MRAPQYVDRNKMVSKFIEKLNIINFKKLLNTLITFEFSLQQRK